MSVRPVFKCPECGKKLTRTLPKRRHWYKSFCESSGRTVRVQAVRPV